MKLLFPLKSESLDDDDEGCGDDCAPKSNIEKRKEEKKMFYKEDYFNFFIVLKVRI